MAYGYSEVVVANAARNANGDSGPLHIERGSKLNLLVNLTAIVGTLDLVIEWSQDGGETWAGAEAVDSFAQMNAVGNKVKQFAVKGSHYRIRWTVGGATPSSTFSIRELVTE